MRANLIQGDAKEIPLADRAVQCVVTSPPYYGLRDYQADGQLGLEPTLKEYIENMCFVFDEVWRVLRDDGVVFLNMGDSYNGSGGSGGDYNAGGLKDGQPRYPGRNEVNLKPKDLMLVPHRLAIALQERGWWIRSDIVWHKPNPMPESVTDRPTKSHEYIFLLTKSARYYYDADAVREEQDPASLERLKRGWNGDGDRGYPGGPQNHLKNYFNKTDDEIAKVKGRNRRDVWTITTKPYSGAHFATFPPEIPEICIKAGTSEKGQCPVCGAPWERVVERQKPPKDVFTKGKLDGNKSNKGMPQAGQKLTNWLNDNPPEMKGWKPTCSCCQVCDHYNRLHGDKACPVPYEPVPQIVLDPFNGSGTTVMVAQQLGRIGIGLDLSPEYLKLARERTGLAQMDAWKNGRKAVEANLEGLPMFSDEPMPEKFLKQDNTGNPTYTGFNARWKEKHG